MSNGTQNYKLGELSRCMEDVEKRIDRMESKNNNDHRLLFKKLESLNTWRWKIIGAVGALAVVGNVIIEIIKDYILK